MKPKYLQMVDALDRMIAQSGQHTMIPSERELAQRYGMSRMTVRKAIDYLVQRNKLYRFKNKGTFIADEKLYKDVGDVDGFSSIVRDAKGEPSSHLVEFALHPADSDVSSRLDIKKGAPVYKVVRLRKKNDVPIMLERAFFPSSVITLDEEIASDSIYEHVESTLGLDIASTEQRFRSTFTDKLLQKHLDMGDGAPVLHIELMSFLKDGRVLEYTNAYVNTDRYELIVRSRL